MARSEKFQEVFTCNHFCPSSRSRVWWVSVPLGQELEAGRTGPPPQQELLPRDSDQTKGTPDLGRAPEANVQNYYHLFVSHEPAFYYQCSLMLPAVNQLSIIGKN